MLNMQALKKIKDCGFVHGVKPSQVVKHKSGCTGVKRIIKDTLFLKENWKGLTRELLSIKSGASLVSVDKYAKELVNEGEVVIAKSGNKKVYRAKL